jgi:hypothetical protein
LKKANEMFSLDEIEAMLEDTAEAIDKQREIDALLSGQLSTRDEDDVLLELDELAADLERGERAAAEAEAPDLPEVPADALPGGGRRLFSAMRFGGQMRISGEETAIVCCALRTLPADLHVAGQLEWPTRFVGTRTGAQRAPPQCPSTQLPFPQRAFMQ